MSHSVVPSTLTYQSVFRLTFPGESKSFSNIVNRLFVVLQFSPDKQMIGRNMEGEEGKP